MRSRVAGSKIYFSQSENEHPHMTTLMIEHLISKCALRFTVHCQLCTTNAGNSSQVSHYPLWSASVSLTSDRKGIPCCGCSVFVKSFALPFCPAPTLLPPPQAPMLRRGSFSFDAKMCVLRNKKTRKNCWYWARNWQERIHQSWIRNEDEDTVKSASPVNTFDTADKNDNDDPDELELR